ncbi:MAG: hypothetical protein ACI308_05730 [Muribaculaceae bacterium]
MKRYVLLLSAFCCTVIASLACTSAIISAEKTVNHRPLLWKHRDTGEEDNKVERVPAHKGQFEYVALYNASDSLLNEAWMGYNSQGFAIMNTASYNLKDDTISDDCMDKEGIVMALALSKCATVDDFEALLDTLPKPLGVEANFGVIDALGNGAYFETNNYTYTRFDLKDSPNGILVRTNYSYSGRTDEGMGYIREANEIALMQPHVEKADFTPIVLTEEISKTYYHSLLGHDFTHDNLQWIVDQDFIPRRSSSASCCIEGIKPGEKGDATVMWINLGFPPCSELRLVQLGDNGVPTELRGILPNGHSQLCDLVVQRKHQVFPIKRGNGKQYLRMSLLYNAEGTGYCQQLIPENKQYYYDKCKQLKRKK